MKKIILISLLGLCTINLSAQNPSTHLTFMGIPINGSPNEFMLKLTNKGMSYIKSTGDITLRQGDFAGFNDCTIGIYANNNIVNSIVVSTPKYDEWTSLETGYNFLKLGLTEKYGDPISCTEEFQSYRYPNNTRKMKLAKTGNLTYNSLFETDEGYINLSILKDHCQIIYTDKDNFTTSETAKYNDL